MRKYFISTLMCENHDYSFLIDTVKHLDFEVGIEYFCFKLTDDIIKKFRELKRALNGAEASFHAPMMGTEGTSTQGSAEYQSLVVNYKNSLALCREFQAKEMVFHTNERKITRADRETMRRNACQNAVMLSKLCWQSGVELLVETLCLPVKGTPILTDEEYVDFIVSENLSSIIDLGHININNYRLDYVMEKLAGRVKAFHVHNNNGLEDSHKGIFEGTFDYVAFAEKYKKFTPNANLIFEYGDIDRTASEFARDIAYLKRLCD